MNDKFDQLAKSMAEPGTRRQALKRFATGIVGVALAGFGLSSQAANDKNCLPPGSFCGHPFGSCGTCCNKSFFCFVNPDVGRLCECD